MKPSGRLLSLRAALFRLLAACSTAEEAGLPVKTFAEAVRGAMSSSRRECAHDAFNDLEGGE